jgi:hypothetical protein
MKIALNKTYIMNNGEYFKPLGVKKGKEIMKNKNMRGGLIGSGVFTQLFIDKSGNIFNEKDFRREIKGKELKELNNKDIELIKERLVNDSEIDLFISNYIATLPKDWRTELDMRLGMKNAMIMALSFPNKYRK